MPATDWALSDHTLGLRLLCTAFLALLFSATVGDLILKVRGAGSLGSRITTWARHYPFFMWVLAFVTGLLVGHFYLSGHWPA